MSPRTSQFSDRKRRVGKACDLCRIRKIRCDGNKPCARCETDKKLCVFTNLRGGRQTHPVGYTEMLEARIDLLTKSLLKVVGMAEPHLPILQYIKERNTEKNPSLTSANNRGHFRADWSESINDLVNYLDFELPNDVNQLTLQTIKPEENDPLRRNTVLPTAYIDSRVQNKTPLDQIRLYSTQNAQPAILNDKCPLPTDNVVPPLNEVSSINPGKNNISFIPDYFGIQNVNSGSDGFPNRFDEFPKFLHGSPKPIIQNSKIPLQTSPSFSSITSNITHNANDPDCASSYHSRQLLADENEDYPVTTDVGFIQNSSIPFNPDKVELSESSFQPYFQPDLRQTQASATYMMDRSLSGLEILNAQTEYYTDALMSGSQVESIYSS